MQNELRSCIKWKHPLFAFVMLNILSLALMSCTLKSQWKESLLEQNTAANAEHYFGIALATQDALVYELSDTSLHEMIRDWISSNKPVQCGVEPWTVGDPTELEVLCECTLKITGITSRFDPAKDYWLVNGFSDLMYYQCQSSFQQD